MAQQGLISSDTFVSERKCCCHLPVSVSLTLPTSSFSLHQQPQVLLVTSGIKNLMKFARSVGHLSRQDIHGQDTEVKFDTLTE